jgi:hypothetical protein
MSTEQCTHWLQIVGGSANGSFSFVVIIRNICLEELTEAGILYFLKYWIVNSCICAPSNY